MNKAAEKKSRKAKPRGATAEAARQHAQRAVVAEKLLAGKTLTAGLLHEIRNPLNAAMLQLTMLARRLRRLAPELQPSLEKPLSTAQEELQRLDEIVERFLEFSRPFALVPAYVDLTEVAESVLATLTARAAERGLRFERSFRPTHPVIGDKDLLKQAVTQLVLNAIDATPVGGWVRVEVTEEDGEVLLMVEDSGAGIPAHLHARLFEPFFTTKEKGAGLGLPKAQSIIQQHGGTLLFQENPAGGARFLIKLATSRPSH